MRVLLTGATGFIGRQCLAQLSLGGHEIHAVSRRRGEPADNVRWHSADLLNPGAIDGLLANVHPDALLHLAWFVSPADYKTSPENSRWTEAGAYLVEAFARAGGRRVLGVGTCMEYDWSDGVLDEATTPLRPHNLYGESKNELRRRIEESARDHGLSWAWARLFFMYGPHEPPARLVPGIIRSLLAGQPAPCSPGQQVRDFLHVEDVAAALVRTLDSGLQGPLNIGSGEGASVRDVATSIAELLGRQDLLRIGALPPVSEPPLAVAKVDRLRLELGWKPRYNLKNGLSSTIQWWRQQTATAGIAR